MRFEGPMITSGHDHEREEVLAAPLSARLARGIRLLDEHTGGVEPGGLWAVSGPSGISEIADYLQHYQHRPHPGIGYRTPTEVARTWTDFDRRTAATWRDRVHVTGVSDTPYLPHWTQVQPQRERV